MNIIAIDTETTGLNSAEDEIIQFSAVDMLGNELADFLIKPIFHERWDAAEKKNGISLEAVKDCPPITDRKTDIERLLNGADLIIGYNIQFDLDFLASGGIELPDAETAETLDVKRIFESIKNEVDEDGISRKRQSLVSCASYYGYDWNGKPHDSLADVRATMFCFQKMFGMI